MRALPFLLSLSVALCADEARIRDLVAQLGADDPEAREAADAELRKMGEEDATGDVERALEEGVASSDVEVATRSRAILDTLRFWQRIVVLGGRKTGGIDVQSGKFAWSRPREWCQAWCGERRRGARAWVFDRDGGLECLDLRTGARHWRVKAPAWGQAVDSLYWLGYASDRVVRISLEDGATAWEVNLPQPIHHVRPASIAADARGVYVETRDYLIALEASSGRELWRTSAALLGLARGALYVNGPQAGGGQGVQRLDPATGKPLWTCAAPGGRAAAKLFDAGKERDLVLVANDLGHICAVNATTGAEAWTFAAKPDALWVEAGGARGWLAAEGALVVLDLSNGVEIARFPRTCDAAHFLEERGVLYVADFDRKAFNVALRAFDVTQRTLIWTSDVQGVETTHRPYWQDVRVERLGERLLFVGESAAGNWIEVVDPRTGQVQARHRP